MDYHDSGHSTTNYKIYWISDHKKILSENDYSYIKIFWAFAKLKYHAVINSQKSQTDQIFHLTLINTNDQLPIEAINFNSVAIDTAYFKKIYVAPFIDTLKSKLKVIQPRPRNYL